MFNDWLNLAGVSALLVILIGPLWKGDDAISESFRNDISDMLMRLDYNQKNVTMQKLGSSVLNRIFGETLISTKSFTISSIFSVLIFFISQYAMESHENRIVNHFIKDIDVSYFTISIILLFFIVLNCLFDFISSLQTRFLYTKGRNGPIRLLLEDIFLTWLIATASAACFFYALSFLERLPEISNSILRLGRGAGIDVLGLSISAIVIPLFASAFVFSIWTTAIYFSCNIIKAIFKYDVVFYLQYILPIQEKPIRSIGIVSVLFLIFSFSIAGMAEWVIKSY